MRLLKFHFFILCALFFISHRANSQVGIKGGIFTTQIDPSSLSLLNPDGEESVFIDFVEAKYGFQAGLFFQIPIAALMIQAEMTYSSNKYEFSVSDFQVGLIDEQVEEVYHRLDLPVLVGLNAGPFRFLAGPVGHVRLNKFSDLVDIEHLRTEFKNITFGWQGGIGIDILKMQFDLRYEGNFTKFGDHISFFGNDYSFDAYPNRLIATIGLTF